MNLRVLTFLCIVSVLSSRRFSLRCSLQPERGSMARLNGYANILPNFKTGLHINLRFDRLFVLSLAVFVDRGTPAPHSFNTP